MEVQNGLAWVWLLEFRALATAAMLIASQSILTNDQSAVAQEALILRDGHVDLGVIYQSGQLSWRINADGATSEGGSPGDLVGLYLPSELVFRVPDTVRFTAPPFPGNPNVTGVGNGPFWILPSSGGFPNLPFPGWSWDMGLSSPPQVNLTQWQNGRIKIELLEVDMPPEANFSNWVGGTVYLSTFNPSLTNAPNVPVGSNSFILPGHDHFNWGFTRAGVYDVRVRATGTHLVDGPKSSEATFRFLVGDDTQPAEPAEVVGAFVYHSAWTGEGSPIDAGKSLKLEGSGLQELSFSHLINSVQGINGLAFDVQNLAAPSQIAASDFEFRWSPQGAFIPQDHLPSAWQLAPAPSSIQVSGTAPSRILIQWPDGSILNRWLRVSLKSTPGTGLEAARVYYCGHLLGETSQPVSSFFTVAFADITTIRNGVGQTVDSASHVDIDKNGTVAFGDISAMRTNVGVQLPAISVP